MFQLWQLHRSQRRVDVCVPAGICWRTVRCLDQQICVEQFFQKLFQKGPEGGDGHRGFALLQKHRQSSCLSSAVPCLSDFETFGIVRKETLYMLLVKLALHQSIISKSSTGPSYAGSANTTTFSTKGFHSLKNLLTHWFCGNSTVSYKRQMKWKFLPTQYTV